MVVGATAGYAALGRATARLAEAQLSISQRQPVRCRTASTVPGAIGAEAAGANDRCTLPERCEYDTVSRTCRETPLT